MTTSNAVVRTALAVAAIFMSVMLLQTLPGQADPEECNAHRAMKTVTLEQGASDVSFKCGEEFLYFYPQDLTKTYTDNAGLKSAVEPVPLKSLVHKAELTLTAARTYKVTVAPSTVVTTDKEFYYFCKKSEDEYCPVKVVVKTRAAKSAVTCDTEAGEAKRIVLDKEDKSIMFSCDATFKTLLPADPLQAYVRKGANPVSLEALYPEATLVAAPNHVYTLTVPTRTASKIIYYRCQKDAEHNCDIQVVVEKNTAEGSVPDSATCATDASEVAITLSAEHPATTFACGLDFPTIDPEDLNHAYDDDKTSNKVQLETIYRKAGLYTESSIYAYGYFLYIPYRETAKTLYFNCKSADKAKTCKVKVDVEANKGVVPVCRNAEGAFLSYEAFSESVSFKCDAALPTIAPSDLSKVYDKDPASPSAEAVALTTLFNGAKLVSDGNKDSPIFTLTIPQHLPREHARKIYYQCKQADDKVCNVRIRVAPKTPEMVTCDPKGEKKFTITAPGEIVRFKCGDQMNLYPTHAEEVYNNEDNKCSTVASLTSLVPQASLAADDEEQEKGRKFTLTELPPTNQALCYACSSNNALPSSASFRTAQEAQQCKVLIEVKSAAESLNAQTFAGHALIVASLAAALFSTF